MAYTPITISGTTATQRGFQLPSGDKVVVDIQQTTQQPNAFNATPDAHLSVQVKVWKVNDDGTPALDARGYRLSPPIRNATVLTAALADGTVDLTAQLTNFTLDSLDRISNWLVVWTQIAALQFATAIANGILTTTSGSGQSTVNGTAFASLLVVTLKDNGGNPITGATITFTVPGSGASASFAGGVTTALTNSSGVATSAPLTANATAGSYSIAASVVGGPAPVSFALINT